jgi:hypothetical protein
MSILYTNPVALDSQKHAYYGLRTIPDLKFASASNIIPINMVEFPLAARDYPIGFVGPEDNLFPAAIVGLQKENLFVDEQGHWKPGAYIPAYVRRYPFLLGQTGSDDKLMLCIEDTPEVLSAGGGQPLFKDGQVTAATQQAIDFCNAFRAAGEETAPFIKALLAAGLLVDRQANAKLSTGTSAALTGFKAVDEEKLRALPARTLNQWNGRNWLVPLYAHIQSMNNWGDLVDLLAERQKAEAA